MFLTISANQPTISQLFTKNETTPWVKSVYIKGVDTKEKVTVYKGLELGAAGTIPKVAGLGDKGTIQKGSGYAQTIAAIIKAAPIVAKGVDKAAFGKIGTNISNTLSERYNKNPEWKPGFAGERHAVLPTNFGLTRANYAGPGTKLQTRLARGDKGVDGPYGIDAAAKTHDIDYYNAKSYSDIRKADKKFIKGVRQSTSTGTMKNLAIGAIKAKNFGEDIGILNKDVFSIQQESQQMGLGNSIYAKKPTKRKKKKVYPAQVLQRLQRANAKK